ncbi:MAG: MCE family protein [Candidatus Omnitrophica bacterium]|nr:MCE family protein [Candidatus Omnitrophota bacterium]
MTGKSNLELKVGIFIFIGILILTLGIFSIGEVYFFRSGYNIKVSFSFASGINVGAAVQVAGIEVGEVKEVNLTYDEKEGTTKAIIFVWLDAGVRIPQDSRAYVNLLGLIGENYLEIIPGTDYKHLLKEGDVLIGRDPASTENLMEVAHQVAVNFESLSGSLNEVLDEETKDALQKTIHNFRDFSENLKVITGRLERGEGKLGAWLKPKAIRKKKK